MIARVALGTAMLLVATIAFAGAASADYIVVGKCSMSGACVGVCVDGVADCGSKGDLACVGFSYQVPTCVEEQSLVWP